MAPGRGALRLTRVALFALTAVGLAGAAHLAGGERVSPLVALAAVPAVMVVINLLASARRGYASLLTAMAGTQVVLHLGFMAGSLTGDCRLVGAQPMAGMAAPAGSAPAMVQCGSGMSGHGGLWPSGTMLAAHALATVLLVVLLAHGEAALWALAAAFGFRNLRTGPALRLPVRARVPLAVTTAFRPRSSVRCRGVRRRGPPVLGPAVL